MPRAERPSTAAITVLWLKLGSLKAECQYPAAHYGIIGECPVASSGIHMM